jgi:hypothetical protein
MLQVVWRIRHHFARRKGSRSHQTESDTLWKPCRLINRLELQFSDPQGASVDPRWMFYRI